MPLIQVGEVLLKLGNDAALIRSLFKRFIDLLRNQSVSFISILDFLCALIDDSLMLMVMPVGDWILADRVLPTLKLFLTGELRLGCRLRVVDIPVCIASNTG